MIGRTALLMLVSLASANAAESLDCSFDLAATRNYELGIPVKATPVPDGSAVLYLRAAARDPVQRLYQFDLKQHREHELADGLAVAGANAAPLSVEAKAQRERARVTAKGYTEFQLSDDGGTVLLSLAGKLLLVARQTGAVRQLPGTDWLAPRLSPDGSSVAAVSGNDLSVFAAEGGQITPLTHAGSATRSNGLADFIAAEELDRQDGLWWSPDGRFLAFEEVDNSDVEPHFIASPAEPAKPPISFRYPRAGTDNARLRLGIVPVAGGPPRWAAWDNADYPYLARVIWPSRGPLTLVVLNRAQTEAIILAVDPDSGSTRELWRETDSAWLDLDASVLQGRQARPMPRWLPDGSGFLWASERDGLWRLERHRADGSLIGPVTPPGFRFGGLLDVDNDGRVLIVAGGTDRLSSGLYTIPLGGGPVLPLADQRGLHSGELGGGHGVIVDSYALADGSRGVRVLDRSGAKLADLPSVAELPPSAPQVSLLAVGGHDLDAQVVWPHHFEAGRHYPVLLSVYGGPTVKNVLAAPRRALAKQCLADRGYIVVTIDNRGTPGRDRAFERAVRGNLIDIALDDQVEGLHALAAQIPEMDLERVGIYGWSFGGYVAAMATVRRGDVFQAGIAGAPVVDWQDYDTAYSERYLGLPADNRDGYRASNLLTYAARLERPLLLIHGLTDDNVYFQHTVKLTQALFAAGKPYGLIILPGTHQLPEPELRAQLDLREAAFFESVLHPQP